MYFRVFTFLLVLIIPFCRTSNTSHTRQASNADTPADPNRVYCGKIPNNIYECLGIPRIVKPEVFIKCDLLFLSECDKIRCIFREEGWMDGDKLDKGKVAASMDQFGKDNPHWSAAAEATKTVCLREDLPAQGGFIDCLAYDIWQCTHICLIRHAKPYTWSTSEECKYAVLYAGACLPFKLIHSSLT